MGSVPFNIEAEQLVLGSIFLEPDLLTALNDLIETTDFFDERHCAIYEAMKNLYKTGTKLDYMTVTTELSNHAKLNLAGGMDYLASLSNSVPSTANVEAYVDIIRDLSLKRHVIEAAKKIAEDGYNAEINSTEYVDMAEEKIFEVAKRRKTSTFSKVSDIAEQVKEKTEKTMKNRGLTTGLVTGFYGLDELTLGLQKEELIIIAARPAMGKSAFAMNIAVNVAKNNKNGTAGVAVFSLEMGSDQIVSRLISCESNIDSRKIKSGNLDPRDWRFFEQGVAALSNLNIFFDDASTITVQDIRAKCRKLSQEGKLDLVVIDYLQLIRGDGKINSRQEEVSNISRSLKQMARELKIPVIALAQLSREVEKRDDKRPIMADLRESGSIEQDADIVMFIYRDSYYHKSLDLDTEAETQQSRSSDTEIIMAKNRSGSLGDGPIVLMFEPMYSRFKNKAGKEFEDFE